MTIKELKRAISKKINVPVEMLEGNTEDEVKKTLARILTLRGRYGADLFTPYHILARRKNKMQAEAQINGAHKPKQIAPPCIVSLAGLRRYGAHKPKQAETQINRDHKPEQSAPPCIVSLAGLRRY